MDMPLLFKLGATIVGAGLLLILIAIFMEVWR